MWNRTLDITLLKAILANVVKDREIYLTLFANFENSFYKPTYMAVMFELHSKLLSPRGTAPASC